MSLQNFIKAVSPGRGTKRKPTPEELDDMAEESRRMKRARFGASPDLDQETDNIPSVQIMTSTTSLEGQPAQTSLGPSRKSASPGTRTPKSITFPRSRPRRDTTSSHSPNFNFGNDRTPRTLPGQRSWSASQRKNVSSPKAYAQRKRPVSLRKRIRRVLKLPPVASPTSKGIPNVRSVCYRNGALQALVHLPRFYQYMGQIHQNCPASADCVVCCLKRFVHSYWNFDDRITNSLHQRPADAARRLLQACKRHPPTDAMLMIFREEIESGRQSDPGDLLEYLLARIDEETDEQSFANMFHLGRQVRWTCQHCGRESVKSGDPAGNTGFVLDVQILQPARGLTLREYLKYSFDLTSTEIRCEHAPCTSKPENVEPGPGFERQRCFRIEEAPEVLFLRLERFRTYFQRKEWKVEKLTDPVPYDEYLDLSEYTHDGTDLVYRLDGVVAHTGASHNYGHYISVSRDYDARTFITIDDSIVDANHNGAGIFTGETQIPRTRHSTFEPYILVYSKCS